MDLIEMNAIPRVMEYKPPMAFKTSDFSIDHILNKAGSSVNNREEYRCLPIENDLPHYHYDTRNDLMNDEYMHCSPILNWLQYSRYHPPRLPRPTKAGPVKRTPGRLPRVPFTPHQLHELETAYKKSTYLSSEDANNLAMQLDLTSTRVKIW